MHYIYLYFFLFFFNFWTSHIDKLYLIYPLSYIELQRSKKKKSIIFQPKPFRESIFRGTKQVRNQKKKNYKRQRNYWIYLIIINERCSKPLSEFLERKREEEGRRKSEEGTEKVRGGVS